MEEHIFQDSVNILSGNISMKSRRGDVSKDMNPTEDDFVIPPESVCVHRLFESQAKRTPDHIAVVYFGTQLTYHELAVRSGELSEYLCGAGIGPDDVVGVCIERSLDMVIAVLGILRAGAAYLPLDPVYPKERLTFMGHDSRMKLLLTQKSYIELFADVRCRKVCIDDLDDKKSPNTRDFFDGRFSAVTPENLAYVIYTSGSTGQPKGVAMAHRPLANLIHWQLQQTKIKNDSNTIQFSPISFDVSFQEIFATLCAGGTLFLISDELRRDSVRLLQFIKENHIYRIFLPFIALQQLCIAANSHDIFPESLKEVITAGEQLQINEHIVGFFKNLPECTLYNQYGPTETHVVTAHELTGRPEGWPKLPPIGRPISNCEAYILNGDSQPVGPGESGELYLGGICLARGYLHRDDLTQQRFIDNIPINGENKRLYRTGDLAGYNQNGDIEYLGRSDNQVKIRGYRIELGELEVTLSSHPDVKQAVVADMDDGDEKILVAYLVSRSGNEISSMAVNRFLRSRLPEFMIPSRYLFLQHFPVTPSGKIDRKALPAPDRSRPEIDQSYVAPQKKIEHELIEIWKDVLKIDEIGVHDGFFDLGGDSIKAFKCVLRLDADKNIKIPIIKVFQYNTVSRLAKYLESQEEFLPSLTKAYERALVNQNRHETKEGPSGSVAIIGMAGRFPGADHITALWENLCGGKESITFFSDAALDGSITKKHADNPHYIKARGVITDADRFDAGFFSVSSLEAQLMDPQQRVFLETAWSAMEDAGYVPEGVDGFIGVFAGMSNNSYFFENVMKRPDLVERFGKFQTMLLNEKDYLATRTAFKLNLTGPCVNVYTACSTSLVAVCNAAAALNSFQCDMAIAGGVTVTSPLNSGYMHQEGAMYSADGHTRPFDANATGTVFSDGCGVVVLKRLTDAIEDQDTIYAVIRGSALNNDGSDKASFTAPSVDGQASVIAIAQTNASIAPETISYVEAHGTATPVGDPIEFEALVKAFQIGSREKQYCALGSIKSNFGHLNAAAGVAGLIKTALGLRYKKIPPMIHFASPNPEIDLESSPFYIATELMDWKSGNGPNRACVSAFGVGGTNAHVILEEAPAVSHLQPSEKENNPRLLLLSAKTPGALGRAMSRMGDYLESGPAANLSHIAYTLQKGRKHFPYRKFIVCSTRTEGADLLRTGGEGDVMPYYDNSHPPKIVFMFPGQGAQYVRMAEGLYDSEPIYREAFDTCAQYFEKHAGLDLKEMLYGDSRRCLDIQQLGETCHTQPVLFAVSYSMARLLLHWGVVPHAMIGHSVGEYVAACLAGVFTLADACYLVARRAGILQEMPHGAMLTVRLGESDVQKYLSGQITLSAVNSPVHCVVAGAPAEIEALRKRLEADNVPAKRINTSHAFHSPLIDPAVSRFTAAMSAVQLNTPDIPFISNVSGSWISDREATSPDYWASHMRNTVRFSDGIRTLVNGKIALFIEVGPGSTLTVLSGRQIQKDNGSRAISLTGRAKEPRAEQYGLLEAVGTMWGYGVNFKWDAFYNKADRARIPLPAYPFERHRYWVEAQAPIEAAKAPDESAATSRTEIAKMGSPASNSRPEKKKWISKKLVELFESVSGDTIREEEFGASFLALGFDSLLLTQASLAIKGEFETEVQFRQLLESFTSIEILADHLVEHVSEDIYPAGMISEAGNACLDDATIDAPEPDSIHGMEKSAGDPPVSPRPLAGNINDLFMRQLAVIENQLDILRNHPSPQQQKIDSGRPEIRNNRSIREESGQGETGVFEKDMPDQPVSPETDEAEKQEKAVGPQLRINRSASVLTAAQKNFLDDFSRRYTEKTNGSKAYTEKHRAHLADPRAAAGFRPVLKELVYPIVAKGSKGSRLWDVDGNEYVDWLNGFGSNFFGYSAPFIIEAVREQMEKGIEIGPQSELAGEVAEMICQAVGMERVAFCNTGSEAVLGALRIARTVTGKNTVVMFQGAYHGIFDEVINRWKKDYTAIPAAPGIVKDATKNILVLPYDDPASIEMLRQRGNDLAAILVEPVQSRAPEIQPKAFLQELRNIATQYDVPLIFDEVITGFRTCLGGAQAYFDIEADIATYGKVIGGGWPIGVIAGKKRFMDALDGGFWRYGDDSIPEAGVTYFAGTFVRHPPALAAARASLAYLISQGPDLQETLNKRCAQMAEQLNAHLSIMGAPIQIRHFGSVMKIDFIKEVQYEDLLFYLLREKNVHAWHHRPCFLTIAHSDEDITFIVDAFLQSVREMQESEFLPPCEDHIEAAGNVQKAFADQPPIPGARLGKDPNGNPAWFIKDPQRPDKYLQLGGQEDTDPMRMEGEI